MHRQSCPATQSHPATQARRFRAQLLAGPVLAPHRQVITVDGLFRPFAPLPEPVTAALRADGGDVVRFLEARGNL